MAGVCKRTVAVWGGVPVNSVNPVNPGESHMRPARVWVYIEGWVTGRVRFPNVRKLVTRERGRIDFPVGWIVLERLVLSHFPICFFVEQRRTQKNREEQGTQKNTEE